ncbi:hypothetical protein [Bacillus mycoides]|uniref:hypothetical protein n=1 Tax=Bacillus mycoides TaxID=1405 RepID=UPI001C02E645|nr:hypothetical protein [Bacillus mycoides]
MEKIQKLLVPKGVRVIVISDIHGELNLLKELLHKVNFNALSERSLLPQVCEGR